MAKKQLEQFTQATDLEYTDWLHRSRAAVDNKLQVTDVVDLVQADLFYGTLSELIAETDTEKVKVGKRVVTYANQNGAAVRQEWKIVDSTALPQDGGQAVALTGVTKFAEQVFSVQPTPEHFGGAYDGTLPTETTAAFNALLAYNGIIYIDKLGARYKLNGTVSSTGKSVSVVYKYTAGWARNGASYQSALIDATAIAATDNVFTLAGIGVETGILYLSGIKIQSLYTDNTGDVVSISNFGNTYLDRCWINGSPRHGLHFTGGCTNLYTFQSAIMLGNTTGSSIEVVESGGVQPLLSWFEYDTDMGGGKYGVNWYWPSGGGSTIGLIRSYGLKSVLTKHEAVRVIGKGDMEFYSMTGENGRQADPTKSDILFGGCRDLKLFGTWASGDAGAATTVGSLVIEGCDRTQIYGPHVDNTTGVISATVPYSMEIRGSSNVSIFGGDIVNGDGRGLDITTTSATWSLANNPDNISLNGVSINTSSDCVAISAATNYKLKFMGNTLATTASYFIGTANLDSSYKSYGNTYANGGSSAIGDGKSWSQTWNAGVIAAGGIAKASVTAVGATIGEPVFAAHNDILTDTVLISAHCRATDIVDVILYNPTGSATASIDGTVTVKSLS